MLIKKNFVFFLFLLSFLLTGCAGIHLSAPSPFQIFALKKNVNGVYHRVKKGQTLWRVSKTYGVPLEELIRINRISDVRRIKTGQLIFIPGTKAKKKVATYQPEYRVTRKKKKIKKIEKIPDLAKGDFVWPAKGRLSSYFGKRKGGFHYGIDIAAPRGREVLASRKGVVSFNQVMRGYGNVVIIDHGDGFSTVYAHNRVNLVKEKEKVKQGQIIARVGSTGRARGSHLHFEIRKDSEAVNPLFYLP
ncbi:MAG: LysM peptidoglycan-binding domain-containing M23 family metallopeptidase [Candidatus Ratteibacteria bacterium]|nr:LysM peptidoglycan-binding domain-containing M23 family metallopeptidase [Candidatus Ratteibacteria bacterium]